MGKSLRREGIICAKIKNAGLGVLNVSLCQMCKDNTSCVLITFGKVVKGMYVALPLSCLSFSFMASYAKNNKVIAILVKSRQHAQSYPSTLDVRLRVCFVNYSQHML